MLWFAHIQMHTSKVSIHDNSKHELQFEYPILTYPGPNHWYFALGKGLNLLVVSYLV